MAADYEAVFEDIMRYTKGSPDGATQADLKRFFRQNDRRGTMSDQLLNKLVDTRSADELTGSQTSLAEIKKRGSQNTIRERQQATQVKRKGKTIAGTYTAKKSRERFVLFRNKQGKRVYYDRKGKVRDEKGRFSKA